MDNKETEPLTTKKLANGIVLRFYDQSRPMVGDRWQVDLVCEAHIPVSEEMWKHIRPDDLDLRQKIRINLGNPLLYSLTKSKPFVDDRDKQGVLAELIGQIEENMEVYLASPDFPQRVFTREYEQVRENLLNAQAQEDQQAPDAPADEDGPADFSDCFKE